MTENSDPRVDKYDPPPPAPPKYLHPIPRTLAALALVVGGSFSIVYYDWRWVLVGVLVMLGCALAGPWEVRP